MEGNTLPPPSRESTPLGFRESTKTTGDTQKSSPETPQKANRPNLGLALPSSQPFSPRSGPSATRIPLSPKLDSSQSFGSSASVLPRRSRGLDFSRACTNLHHSTLAESSPDSSPVVGGRGIAIPQRRGPAGTTGMVGSPSSTHYNILTSGANHVERATISSSVGSINMVDSDSSSTGDDEADDGSIHGFDATGTASINTKKQPGLGLSAPFSPSLMPVSGADWMSGFSAAKASLMNFQRSRYRNCKKRHSSSSASGASPRLVSTTRSPSTEKVVDGTVESQLSHVPISGDTKSRLDELGHVPSDFHLSDGSDDCDMGKQAGGVSSPSSSSLAGGSNSESGRRGVIRRPVTRRGNLLPKPKNFARIRATLFEECAPVESDTKKEAEVVRQVRESDPSAVPQPQAIFSSTLGVDDPGLPANVPGPKPDQPASLSSFRQQVTRNSGGISFWNSFDGRYKTPPPFSAGDLNRASPGMESGSLGRICRDIDIEPEVFQKFNKRRRGDDFDLASFKRRAVSPGPSAQNSPIQSHTSAGTEGSRVGHLSKSILCQTSNSSETPLSNTSTGPVKRVGLQGMTETSDGLMKMSID